MSKNLDETVQVHSEKRQEWIREVRDYKGLQKPGAALSHWRTHQPRRSPGEISVRGTIVA